MLLQCQHCALLRGAWTGCCFFDHATVAPGKGEESFNRCFLSVGSWTLCFLWKAAPLKQMLNTCSGWPIQGGLAQSCPFCSALSSVWAVGVCYLLRFCSSIPASRCLCVQDADCDADVTVRSSAPLPVTWLQHWDFQVAMLPLSDIFLRFVTI